MDFQFAAKETTEAVDVESGSTTPEATLDERADGGAQQPVTEPRRSQREHRPCVRYGIDEFFDAAAEIEHLAFNVSHVSEPAALEEVLNSELSQQWKEATDSEYQSLQENETWELVGLTEVREAKYWLQVGL